MIPAVVVDLGSQISPTEASWVLDACNAAIVRGSCELDVVPDSEPPRAIAIMRLLGDAGGSVRLELGLRGEDRSSWAVREIEFSSQDPARERWRSVGLVLATLVGEVEAQREADTNSAPSSDSTPSGQTTSSEVEATRTTSAAPIEVKAAPEGARNTATPAARAPVEARPHAPLPRPSVFVGAGVLAGPGPDVDPERRRQARRICIRRHRSSHR